MQDKKKLALSVAFLFLLNLWLIWLLNLGSGARAASFSVGQTGEEVRQIQEALSERGYYEGAIDGLFGPVTEAAVARFQEDNHLPGEGVCGIGTLECLGLLELFSVDSPQSALAEYEMELLARLVCAEGSELSFEAQIAVAAVVLNRVDCPAFPDTIAGVVYQPGAFKSVTDRRFRAPVTQSARAAARRALSGPDISDGALFYQDAVPGRRGVAAGAKDEANTGGGAASAGNAYEKTHVRRIGDLDFYQ